jgi:SsrA-binding protein
LDKDDGVSQDRRKEAQRFIVQNRAATFHYEIEDRFEGGLVLVGSEVKSLRDGRVDLSDAYAAIERGEVWLKQTYIAPFAGANAFPHEVRRSRKVLLHAHEIRSMAKALTRDGLTLIPLDLFFKEGRVKVTLGLGKGKKSHDKRASIAKKTADREALQAVKAGRSER